MLVLITLGLVLAYAAVAAAALVALRSGSGPSTTTPSSRSPFSAPAGESRDANKPVVSVLVAARNEAGHLPDCLHALQTQTLDPRAYEIIVIDDHSDDDTAGVAEAYGVRCIRLSDASGTGAMRAGKAAALHAGMMAARSDLIAVTDADCRPPSRWLSSMVRALDDDEVGMVCGVTVVAGRSLLARIQAADWTLLLTIAAGFSALGLPITAMGNNMLFRREAYDAVGGYPALPESVTEDFVLFRAIHRHTRWRVRLALDRELLNVTLPLPTLPAVVRQRRRWARGGLRADGWVYLVYGIVYAAHLAIVAALFAAPIWGLPMLGLKLLVDGIVLHAGGRRLGQRHLRPTFLLFEIYLFAYVLLLPLLLALAPRVRWRGRRW